MRIEKYQHLKLINRIKSYQDKRPGCRKVIEDYIGQECLAHRYNLCALPEGYTFYGRSATWYIALDIRNNNDNWMGYGYINLETGAKTFCSMRDAENWYAVALADHCLYQKLFGADYDA